MNNYKRKNGFILEEDNEGSIVHNSIIERVIELDDELSIDIVLSNIESQINGSSEFIERANFVTLFKNKVNAIKDEINNNDGQLKQYLIEAVEKVVQVVLSGLSDKYMITLGETLDETVDIYEYLEKVEALYEFFFIRNFNNLKDVLYKRIVMNKKEIYERYKNIYTENDEGDLFMSISKKKFKDKEDVIIINYIIDIIRDVQAEFTSAYEMFKEITNLDLYEMYNNTISKLIDNYGIDFMIEDDEEAVNRYFKLLDEDKHLTNIRNEILLKYLETVEINPNYGNEHLNKKEQ